MVPWSLFSLFLAFQSNPILFPCIPRLPLGVGFFGWGIIIILSIVPLIGLVSLIHGSEEFGVIGVDCENCSYFFSDPETRTAPRTLESKKPYLSDRGTTGRLFVFWRGFSDSFAWRCARKPCRCVVPRCLPD